MIDGRGSIVDGRAQVHPVAMATTLRPAKRPVTITESLPVVARRYRSRDPERVAPFSSMSTWPPVERYTTTLVSVVSVRVVSATRSHRNAAVALGLGAGSAGFRAKTGCGPLVTLSSSCNAMAKPVSTETASISATRVTGHQLTTAASVMVAG